MKTETYVVTVERPDDVSVAEMKNYIREAVNRWSKCGDPTSGLWWAVCTWVKRLPTADSIRKNINQRREK